MEQLTSAVCIDEVEEAFGSVSKDYAIMVIDDISVSVEEIPTERGYSVE